MVIYVTLIRIVSFFFFLLVLPSLCCIYDIGRFFVVSEKTGCKLHNIWAISSLHMSHVPEFELYPQAVVSLHYIVNA